jgi:hypothetical protein
VARTGPITIFIYLIVNLVNESSSRQSYGQATGGARGLPPRPAIRGHSSLPETWFPAAQNGNPPERDSLELVLDQAFFRADFQEVAPRSGLEHRARSIALPGLADLRARAYQRSRDGRDADQFASAVRPSR